MPRTELRSIENNRLFSNQYLKKRLPEDERWRGSASQRELLANVKRIYRSAGDLVDSGNERQIRDDVINRILKLLGHHFLSDQRLEVGGEPDYIFFPDEHSKQRKELTNAIAVGDAKDTKTDFDKAIGGRSPVWQVYQYMTNVQTTWGMLTDGKRWLLLHRNSPSDRYLEVDLYDIAERSDEEEWLYFYNLFHRQAFEPPGGPCFLDSVREGSATYAQQVGDELTERVYRALLELAQGFASYPDNGLDVSDEGTRRTLRQSCFVLLYRLLFIFYAEAEDLLPKTKEGYRDLSLETLRGEVNGASRDGSKFHPRVTKIWGWLKSLFTLVDQGDVALGIPPYNGGLFSPSGEGLEHAEFLSQHEIGDRHLARAIDFLGTTPSLEDRHGFVNVDYGGLEIRHLGSIYERLLEYRLAHADSDLVAVRKEGRDVWIDAEEYSGRTPMSRLPAADRVARGELYLETDRHERKATGSFYTPDYVVKYIVEKTLTPIVQRQTSLALDKGTKQSEAILSINVCDPAMGSGHFLVEATEFLGNALLRAIEEDQEKGLVATSEYDLVWAKREVVRHCIYGVDLNDLAVELAKVSLWLTTISGDRPLSFLDHRLKCGDSLIGALLADLKHYPEGKKPKDTSRDSTLPEFVSDIFLDRLVGKIKELEAIGEDRREDIKEKEEALAAFKQLSEYEKSTAIADVHTAVHFGLTLSSTSEEAAEKTYFNLVYALDFPSNWEPLARRSWFKQAQEISEQRRFFHWELEFPDVFLADGSVGENGFDAVIGNPPYDVVAENVRPGLEEEIEYYKRNYWQQRGKLNLYRLMTERVLTALVRKGGSFGFIVPNTILADQSTAPIRKLLFESAGDLEFLEFPESAQVFPEITQAVCVFVATGAGDGGLERFRLATGLSEEDVEEPPFEEIEVERIRKLDEQLLPIVIVEGRSLLYRLAEFSKLGDDKFEVWVAQGEVNLTVYKECLQREGGAPLIRGDQIRRYRLVKPGSDKPARVDPACYERKSKGSSKKSLPTFERVLVQEVANMQLERRLKGTVVSPGTYAGHTTNSLKPERQDPYFLLALINSKLLNWRFKATSSTNHVSGREIRHLCWPEVDLKAESAASTPLEALDAGMCDRTLHDYLAGLAREMSEMHEKIQSLSQGFLDWCESPTGLGIKIDALKNKTAFLEFTEHPDLGDEVAREELEQVLAMNRHRLSREDLLAFRAEYDDVASRLNPLVQQSRDLDTKIDAIVYRLFGLEPREIAIVEGCSETEAARIYKGMENLDFRSEA